jgi:ABC-type sulfate transport system permease component
MIHHDHSTAIGTTTGTALSVFATLDTQDYTKTIVLACVGAVVSFMVTVILKWVWGKLKKRFFP